MRFTILLVFAIVAVALAKPHHKKSSESSSSEEGPKHKGHHHKHHKHTHRPHTSPAPVTEEVSTLTPEHSIGTDPTSEEPEMSTQGADVTTTPVDIVVTDAATAGATEDPAAETSLKPDVTVEAVTIGE
ncbi:hypothetical protein OESDEN_16146 [Oesophagostomum dentatum]|uniref:Uncharacterized protein n=1 Tax=Oesophagostomum dentatum TaxID=61180 RepID=A0A0B1SGX9_OESDE|nr:hypothetical protein OESDEN_16146 [Oesophagostomum dentatum]